MCVCGLQWRLTLSAQYRCSICVCVGCNDAAVTSANKSQKRTSNSTSNSYLRSSWMYQHLPNHRVPSLFDSSLNQSMSAALLFSTYFHTKHTSTLNCNTSDSTKNNTLIKHSFGYKLSYTHNVYINNNINNNSDLHTNWPPQFSKIRHSHICRSPTSLYDWHTVSSVAVPMQTAMWLIAIH